MTYVVKAIRQVDNHTFAITWSDGRVQEFRLSDLQRQCPCASCVDEATGERRLPPEAVSDEVRAKRVQSVGRYALRIDFTQGCSQGIYSFDVLRSLGKMMEAAT